MITTNENVITNNSRKLAGPISGTTKVKDATEYTYLILGFFKARSKPIHWSKEFSDKLLNIMWTTRPEQELDSFLDQMHNTHLDYIARGLAIENDQYCSSVKSFYRHEIHKIFSNVVSMWTASPKSNRDLRLH